MKPRHFKLGPLALLLATTAAAQVGDRPRVGLVLGGGGARGAAHVGVLQVLEELQVPVDIVVGTSMGSIVGGLYAAGRSPAELQQILEEARWDELLSDAPPRDARWFRRRQDERGFLVDLELGLRDGGPVAPPGLLLGRNIELFLSELLLPVATTPTFDDLALPFRCVAADLADGTAVVLAEGPLARAIRASMSLPGVFAPVEVDGRLLVDGGIVDNVPIDVARSLGADVVIVVDVSSPLADAATLRSVFGVSGQVIGILTSANRNLSMASLRPEDIGLVPALHDVTTLSFERATRAIVDGRAAAEAARERLVPLAVDDTAWAAWLARQRAAPREAPTARQVHVASDALLAPGVLAARASLAPGARVDAAALRRASERLAGLGMFEHIDVELAAVAGSPDEVDVTLRPREKSWGPHYVRFGLGVASDLRGGGEFDVGVRHTWTPVNAMAGEWRNEVQVGSRTRLFSEFYQPLDQGLRWFVAPSFEYAQDDYDLRFEGDPVATVDTEVVEAAVAIGRNLGDFGELRTSYGRSFATARPEVALPGSLPRKIELDAGTLTTSLRVDTLDSARFPRRGFLGDATWEVADESFGSEERGSTVAARAAAPLQLDELVLFPSLEGGTTVDGEGDLNGPFSLGGFQRLSGLETRERTGAHYGLGVLQAYRPMSGGALGLGTATYLGATLEVGGVWEEQGDVGARDLLLSGSVFVAADSFVGPAYVALGLTEGGETAAYVFIGAVF